MISYEISYDVFFQFLPKTCRILWHRSSYRAPEVDVKFNCPNSAALYNAEPFQLSQSIDLYPSCLFRNDICMEKVHRPILDNLMGLLQQQIISRNSLCNNFFHEHCYWHSGPVVQIFLINNNKIMRWNRGGGYILQGTATSYLSRNIHPVGRKVHVSENYC